MEEYFKRQNRKQDIRFILKTLGYALVYLAVWVGGLIMNLEFIIWWLKFRGVL